MHRVMRILRRVSTGIFTWDGWCAPLRWQAAVTVGNIWKQQYAKFRVPAHHCSQRVNTLQDGLISGQLSPHEVDHLQQAEMLVAARHECHDDELREHQRD